jgi:hypothetical protein
MRIHPEPWWAQRIFELARGLIVWDKVGVAVDIVRVALWETVSKTRRRIATVLLDQQATNAIGLRGEIHLCGLRTVYMQTSE